MPVLAVALISGKTVLEFFGGSCALSLSYMSLLLVGSEKFQIRGSCWHSTRKPLWQVQLFLISRQRGQLLLDSVVLEHLG